METEKSINTIIKPSPKYLRIFFFICGIVATIAYRIIFLLNSFWIEVAWYVGTIGFIFYFGYSAYVASKRATLVKDYELVEVIEKSDVSTEKKSALLYLIKTSLTSKARFNSAFIFIASIIFFIINLATDMYHLLLK